MINRRAFAKKGVTTVVGMLASLISPDVLSNTWPRDIFDAIDLNDTLSRLGAIDALQSEVTIIAPELVEDGSTVPLSISTTLQNMRSICILAEQNKHALVAKIDLSMPVNPPLMTRIRLARSSQVIVLIEADAHFCKATRYIKVVKGGFVT